MIAIHKDSVFSYPLILLSDTDSLSVEVAVPWKEHQYSIYLFVKHQFIRELLIVSYFVQLCTPFYLGFASVACAFSLCLPCLRFILLLPPSLTLMELIQFPF